MTIITKEKKREYRNRYAKNHPEKIKEERKKHYKRHKVEIIERNKKWHYEHKDKVKIIMRKYYLTHKESIKKRSRERTLKIRNEIIRLLGGKCSNSHCPIPSNKMDIRALQIDHIHGGGNKHRKKSGNYNDKILKEIKNGTKEYQILCAYCNWIKRYENNEFYICKKTYI